MTLEKLEPCCKCPDHQRIYRNEDGWVLTQDFEAWMPAEWRRHCSRYSPVSLRLEIARRIVAGENVNDLAREYGITTRTIQRYRRWYQQVAA
jgi:hypothetical protein